MTGAEARVLVIGAAGVDVVGRLEGEVLMGHSNPARVRTSFGGVARNVAENLARLGQPVRLVTVFGEDVNGQSALQHIQSLGVDVSAVLRTSEYPTGFYMAVINANGRVEVAVDDMRIIASLTPDFFHQHLDVFDDVALIFIDANLSEDTIEFIIKTARHRQIPVCADPASSSLALRLLTQLPKLHLVTPNALEASILTGRAFEATDHTAALEAARHLASLGVKIALVTVAEFGVCYATSETSGHIPAIHTQVLDPTGVGDAMTATIIFGLLNDIELDDAVRLGISAATLTLRTPGTVCKDLTLERLYDQLIL